MSGEEFKNILSEHGYNPARVYNALGMSSQAFNQLTKVADIKTSFLERFCKELDVTMSFFYPNCVTNSLVQNFKKQSAHNIANGSGDINENGYDSATIEDLRKTIEDLRKDKEHLEQDKQDLRDTIAYLKMQLQEK